MRLKISISMSSRSAPLVAFCALALTGVSAGCVQREPSELVPLASKIEGLPGVGAGYSRIADMTISNGGEKEIVVAGAAFEALTGHEGEEQGFEEPLLGWPTERDGVVPPHEQMTLRFRYTCPDGEGPSALLVVTSDAEVNPRLEIEVHVDDFVPVEGDGGAG